MRIAPAAIPHHRHSYLGHEVVGEVIEVGEDVQHLRVGDRVVLQHGPNCLSAGLQIVCRSCASGNYALCERGNLPGARPIGGGWSEEMLVSEQQLFCISADMSDEQAVLLEPTAVALHAALRHLPQPAERVLIIGAGTIGLLTLQVIRALSPHAEVSVMARHPFQVEQATRMGAAHIIYPQDSYTSVQRVTEAELYQGLFGNQMLLGGYDVIYDTIGNNKTLHHALRWARAKATLVLLGLSLHTMNIDLTPIWYQEVNLLGSLAHGVETWPPDTNKQRSTFSIAHELIEQGQLHPEQLITHHFALTDYRHALRTAADKAHNRAIKVVFDYALLPASIVPNVRASARQHRQAITEVVEDRQSREAQEVEQTIVALPADTENAPTTTNGATHAPQKAEGPFTLQRQPPGRSRRKNTKSSNTSE
jgi:2-desacetyl-2-hydroxyethyl bacteriochlorophyllide A dehydrogenase